VIVEKPLEITLKRCDAIINACEKAGVKLATIFPSRFHASSRAIRRAVEKNRFGKLTLGDAYVKWFRTQQYYDGGKWRGTWELDGGGALMNQAIHSVDLLTWLMGPVVEIRAQWATLAHERIAVEDTAVAALKYASGALGVIEGATSVFPGWNKRIEISGDKGSVILEDDTIKFWQFAEETAEDENIRSGSGGGANIGGGVANPMAISTEGHRRQIEDLCHAIREGRQPAIPGSEARKAVSLINAIYESAKSGKPATPA
jgi:UDP-N-acetyl-2-amino-2-deoxyglucuronate dehydrogenase